jgi:hypothetical protein
MGGRGLSAAAMLDLLRPALAAERPALVLWQTGTVEAVRGLPADGLRATLQAGAAMVRGAGADLVLIGPEYSRLLREHSELGRYRAVLAAIGADPGDDLFDRTGLTERWIESGALDLEHAAKEDRQKLLELRHACVGTALARFLLNGAAP